MHQIKADNFKNRKAHLRVDFNVLLKEHFRVIDESKRNKALLTSKKVLYDMIEELLL